MKSGHKKNENGSKGGVEKQAYPCDLTLCGNGKSKIGLKNIYRKTKNRETGGYIIERGIRVSPYIRSVSKTR